MDSALFVIPLARKPEVSLKILVRLVVVRYHLEKRGSKIVNLKWHHFKRLQPTAFPRVKSPAKTPENLSGSFQQEMKTAIQLQPNISLIKSLKESKSSLILQSWYTIKPTSKNGLLLSTQQILKFPSQTTRDVLSG